MAYPPTIDYPSHYYELIDTSSLKSAHFTNIEIIAWAYTNMPKFLSP